MGDNFLSRLPKDIWVRTLKNFLPAGTLLTLAEGIEDYREIVENQKTWSLFLGRDFSIKIDVGKTPLSPRFYYFLFYRGMKPRTTRSFSHLPPVISKFLFHLDELSIESISDTSVGEEYEFRVTYSLPSSGLRIILEHHPHRANSFDSTISFYRVNTRRVTYAIFSIAEYIYLTDEIWEVYQKFISPGPITLTTFQPLLGQIDFAYNDLLRWDLMDTEVFRPRISPRENGFDISAIFSFKISIRY